jgi:hypothetical protein
MKMPFGMGKEQWEKYKTNPNHYLGYKVQKGKLLKPYTETRKLNGKTYHITMYGVNRKEAFTRRRR